MNAKQLFQKLLKENKLCTLATASKDAKPEAATIYFASDSKNNIYFETFTTYKKYANLKANPQASIVITKIPYTAQIEATVIELTGKNEQDAKNLLIKKLNKTPPHYHDKRIRFFKLTPNRIKILTEPKYPFKFELIK